MGWGWGRGGGGERGHAAIEGWRENSGTKGGKKESMPAVIHTHVYSDANYAILRLEWSSRNVC